MGVWVLKKRNKFHNVKVRLRKMKKRPKHPQISTLGVNYHVNNVNIGKSPPYFQSRRESVAPVWSGWWLCC